MSVYTCSVVAREISPSELPSELAKAEKRKAKVEKRLKTLQEAYDGKLGVLTKGGKVNAITLSERGLLRKEIELAKAELEEEENWVFCLGIRIRKEKAWEEMRKQELERIAKAEVERWER